MYGVQAKREKEGGGSAKPQIFDQFVRGRRAPDEVNETGLGARHRHQSPARVAPRSDTKVGNEKAHVFAG
jgi:hypothetical protein